MSIYSIFYDNHVTRYAIYCSSFVLLTSTVEHILENALSIVLSQAIMYIFPIITYHIDITNIPLFKVQNEFLQNVLLLLFWKHAGRACMGSVMDI